MLSESKIYSEWTEALRQHAPWMAEALREQMREHAEEQLRMQTPCARHTRAFLKQISVDPEQPVVDIIAALNHGLGWDSEKEEGEVELDPPEPRAAVEWTEETKQKVKTALTSVSSHNLVSLRPRRSQANGT